MVSTVVPNYNYRKYLDRRLSSILNQTCRDMEIIFIDDGSTDGSAEFAEESLRRGGLPYRILKNRENSRSVFAQWQRGLEEARGEYIWFAEADDACGADFLESTVAVLKSDSSIGLAYTASVVIDEHDRVIDPDFYAEIHRRIDPGKWQGDYINDGRAEIREALSVMNTIPNASAVVMRTEALKKAGGVPLDFSLSGDWLTYVRVLQENRIGYISRPLNCNRLHADRVTFRLDTEEVYFRESLRIAEIIAGIVDVPESSQMKYLQNLFRQYRSGSVHLDLPHYFLPELRRIFSSALVDRTVSGLITSLARENSLYSRRFVSRLRRITLKKIFAKCFKKKIRR